MEKIQVQSLDDLYHRYCEGHTPKKSLNCNGKFCNRFGPEREYDIASDNGSSGLLRDFVKDQTIRWSLPGHTFKKSTYKKPKQQKKATEKEIKDVSKEFEKFSITQSHPYTTAKEVSIANLNFRQDRGNLLIPFYTLYGHFISGWQVIWSQTDSEGKWPKTTRKGSSNKNIYCPLGETKEGEDINVAEGPSTALSLLKISRRQTICTFGKNNMDAIAWYLIGKYPDKMINVYLDFDEKDQFIPTIKHKRLRFFRPDKPGDFNDFQNIENEIQKIKNCYPTWEAPEMELPKDAMELKKQFDEMGYEIRLNSRKDRLEISGFKGNENWREITDEEHSLLYLKAKGPGKLTKTDYVERLKAVASCNEVDPFAEYLKSIVWDNKKRLKNVLTNLFNIEDKYKPLAEWAFRSILLGAVTRTFEPGAKHDEFVILQGSQGIGKSSLLFFLFKDNSLFSNSINFSSEIQRIVESTLGKVIVEVSELAGFGQANIEKMKNVITAQQDTVRLSYRKNARDYKRQCIFVGTTNNVRPLPDDPTGNRRFIFLEMKKKMEFSQIRETIKKDRDQLWAEAVWEYNKGVSSRLPKELWDISAELAEKHRGGDHIFEEVFLSAVQDQVNTTKEGELIEVHIPSILKFLKDGVEEEEKGRTIRRGGGWIKDMSPKRQSTCADILKGIGYKDEGKKWIKGKRIRIHTKKKEVKSKDNEVKRSKIDVNIPQNTPINDVKTKKVKPPTLSASEEFGPLGYNKELKKTKNEEDIGPAPF